MTFLIFIYEYLMYKKLNSSFTSNLPIQYIGTNSKRSAVYFLFFSFIKFFNEHKNHEKLTIISIILTQFIMVPIISAQFTITQYYAYTNYIFFHISSIVVYNTYIIYIIYAVLYLIKKVIYYISVMLIIIFWRYIKK